MLTVTNWEEKKISVPQIKRHQLEYSGATVVIKFFNLFPKQILFIAFLY